MAAVLATLEAIEKDNMISNAQAVESFLRDSLAGISDINGVRGKGCLLGIEFEHKSSDVHSTLLEKRIITGTSSDPNVLRLLPPLSVTTDELSKLVAVLNG